MTQQIPGFYYDEEKKKYFRIQRNHHVLPISSSVHTVQTVKAKNEAKKTQQRQQQRNVRKNADHIHKSSLAKSFGFGLLQRRIGSKSARATDLVAREFSEKLTSRAACGTSLHEKPFGKIAGSVFHISREGLLNAVLDTSIGNKTLLTAWPSSAHESEGRYAYTTSGTGYDEVRNAIDLHEEPDLITGFNIPYDNMICYSDGSSYIRMARSLEYFNATIDLPFTGIIRDMAASPTTNEVAVCQGDHLYLILCPTTAAEATHTRSPVCPKPSYKPVRVQINGDVFPEKRKKWKQPQMTVAFKDANIIMTGEHSGIVNLCDRRSATGTSRLRHASAILGVSPTKNVHQIIVHGFSKTAIYDLRYTRAPTTSEIQAKVTDRSRGNVTIPYSTPVLEFAVPSDRHSDRYTRGQKLAYSAELDMVAANSAKFDPFDHSHSYVTLYSAKTGKVLPGPLTNHLFTDPVTCVDFKRLRDGPESIVTLGNGDLLEWTVHSDIDGEKGSSKWTDFNSSQRSDYLDRQLRVPEMVKLRPDLYSIARRWEDGNLGPIV